MNTYYQRMNVGLKEKGQVNLLQSELDQVREENYMLKEELEKKQSIETEYEKQKLIIQDLQTDLQNQKVKQEAHYKKLEITTDKIDRVEVVKLQKQLQAYEQQLPYLTNEIEKLNEIAKAKSAETETYKIKIFETMQLKQQLDRQRSGFEVEAQRLKNIIEQQTRGYAQARENQPNLEQFESKIIKLHQEIESLTVRLKEKLLENEEVKSINTKMQIEIHSVVSLETRLKEYEQRVSILIAEIEKQTIIFSDKSRECEAWKSRFEELEQNNNEKSVLEMQLHELQTKYSEVESHNFMLAAEIANLTASHQQAQQQVAVYEVQLQQHLVQQSAQTDIQQIFDKRTNELQGEIEQWRNRYVDLQKTISDKKEEFLI